MPDFEFFRVAVEGPLATVTLNRPDRMNTLGVEPWMEMHLVQDYIEDNPGIRVVIINAQGPNFCVGVDLKDLPGFNAQVVANSINKTQRAYSRWQEMNAVVIAAIHGICWGAGFEMITACDIRIATEDARMAILENRFGLAPDMGGTQRLPRLVGAGQAKRLILACEEIDGREAYQIGLVDILTPDYEALQARARLLAQRILDNPPWGVRFGKKAINASQDSSIAGGLLLEQIQSAFCCNTEDQNEAVAAFFEKRKPIFKDR